MLECLRRDPNHASAPYVLARLYFSTGRENEARELLAKFKNRKNATGHEAEPGENPPK